MNAITDLSRRSFLKSAGLAAGSLVVSVSLPLQSRAGTAAAPATINAFLAVTPEGRVIFQNPFCEMGQGVYTSIPQVVAEELDVELASIEVRDAPPGPDYKIMFGNTKRFTGGSFSVRSSFTTLRKAGAAARAMLIQAAADRWGVSPDTCQTMPGTVVHGPTGRRLSYGEVAAKAAGLEPPADPPLKDPSRFRLIGESAKRTDVPAKVNGSAEFGIDVRVPGMVYAAIRQSPVFGGTVASVDAAAVAGMPGMISVENLESAVAVVADSFWRAQTALEALPVTFDAAGHDGWSSASLLADMSARLDEPGVAAETRGDAAAALAGAETVVEAVYDAPFLAHVTMEPMNCTARVSDGTCEVWAPNQAPDFVAGLAAKLTGLPPDEIIVHTPFLGGGFGRRFTIDYVAQAVTLAQRVGRPVKLVWTREEDTQHDFYRPLATAKLRAGLDAAGRPTALHVTAVGDGPFRRHVPGSMKSPDLDQSVVEGLIHQPYAIPNARVDYVYHAIPAPIGFWRSVGNSMNAFFKEGFVDELAAAAGADPVDFRRGLLAEAPRHRAVLDHVADMAGWRAGTYTGPDGGTRAMGVALHESFGSIVGQVAEVSVADGEARVHRVWCAVDCGRAVNPAIIGAQIESGVAYGLSAALMEEVTVEGGRVQQANFDTYPILPPDRMPEIWTRIIESGAELGGIGEVGTPPIAPALTNALFALTGQRLRSLPLSKVELRGA